MAKKRRRYRQPGRLTAQMERFCDEFVVDLNGTAAAIRAGYSTKTAKGQASRLLTFVNVQARIAALQAARSARTAITADRVLFELARIGFVDCRRFYDAAGHLKAPKDIDDDTAAALASVEIDEIWMGSGEEREIVGQTKKVKTWNKLGALQLLGKHLGLFREAAVPEDEQFIQLLVATVLRHIPRREARQEILGLVEAQLGRAVSRGIAAPDPG